ncbi:hypothetical protein Tco_1543875 [Tanacetum coccineum]
MWVVVTMLVASWSSSRGEGCRGDDDDGGDDEDGGGLKPHAPMVGGCGGDEGVSRRGWRRVTASRYGDRVDPVTGTLFGVGQKSPSENFSDGGVVAVAGIRRRGRAAGIHGEGESDIDVCVCV